jgi:hypothetical protein
VKLDGGALSLSEQRAGLTDGFFLSRLVAAAAIAGLCLVAPLLHDGWDAGDRRDL